MQALGVEEHSRVDVAYEGVIRPTVPEPSHDVIKFACHTVTLVVLHLIGHAKVKRGIRV